MSAPIVPWMTIAIGHDREPTPEEQRAFSDGLSAAMDMMAQTVKPELQVGSLPTITWAFIDLRTEADIIATKMAPLWVTVRREELDVLIAALRRIAELCEKEGRGLEFRDIARGALAKVGAA